MEKENKENICVVEFFNLLGLFVVNRTANSPNENVFYEVYNYCIVPRFFFGRVPNPIFCVPSRLVSWSAQPLDPPVMTLVLELHDI